MCLPKSGLYPKGASFFNENNDASFIVKNDRWPRKTDVQIFEQVAQRANDRSPESQHVIKLLWIVLN